MSKYRTKFKTINTQIVTPLDELINELEYREQQEFEQPESEHSGQPDHLEGLGQLSNNQHSIFYRLNHAETLNNGVLIAMLSGMLLFTLSLCSQDNKYALTGLAIALAAFFLRAIIELIGDAMENNKGSYIYQSHYRS
ncbi:hypothetical protein OQJ18_13575 [Fluoribacter dumoffii]|uniref:Uncharacterized protein n=1 Tax=Fluoribacter dumoffii TaxID=463 RepID=A0A377GEF2_9GAMM|nr:hypothetical protein [Fluoribacter dumoffii]KTC91253.1 hypothetical protein Ldum_2321 [Fluoribacter dumoffii NY 23]MCW8387581.1 hypothetical protein [Fluoribacter dumoffii]MCW8416874.1 hypothetical protein [Fluoribacter dumoffii]MCW8455286.1 hypothetical protein [Fluoribacter dumoffii]MCW8460636.1 hypothetical protein [Fluoribacter dumoffii]